MMKIDVGTNDWGPVIALTGRFDAHETQNFREVAEPLTKCNNARITVDLCDVNFVDSSALAELVRLLRQCSEHDIELVLENPSKPVAVILDLTRLTEAFSVDVLNT